MFTLLRLTTYLEQVTGDMYKERFFIFIKYYFIVLVSQIFKFIEALRPEIYFNSCF